jgi:hypothetical protein
LNVASDANPTPLLETKADVTQIANPGAQNPNLTFSIPDQQNVEIAPGTDTPPLNTAPAENVVKAIQDGTAPLAPPIPTNTADVAAPPVTETPVAPSPANDAPNPFTDTLSKLQTAGGLIGAAANALAQQQIPQQVKDAFNAANKFLQSPADPGLVDFADRQQGAVVGLAEGLGLLPDLQIADSGAIDGFSSVQEILNRNPSQAFQDSRQANNTIGFGLPFVLEGGGVGKPPASSPEAVPAGPGIVNPVENPAPLVRAPETGPLKAEDNQGNQGPLQAGNENLNNQRGAGGDTPSNLNAEEPSASGSGGVLSNIPLNEIKYSQGDVSRTATGLDGKRVTIDQAAENIRANGFDPTGAPDVVKYLNGDLVTLDHRRLVAANRAGIEEVPARVHLAEEPLPPKANGRFRLDQLGEPITDPRTGTVYQPGAAARNYGEAALFRSANQRQFGFSDFPLQGSTEVPKVRGE